MRGGMHTRVRSTREVCERGGGIQDERGRICSALCRTEPRDPLSPRDYQDSDYITDMPNEKRWGIEIDGCDRVGCAGGIREIKGRSSTGERITGTSRRATVDIFARDKGIIENEGSGER